jgi:hypothetical protein
LRYISFSNLFTTLPRGKISGKDANIGGKVLNQRDTIPKLPLRKNLRADGDLARIVDQDYVCGGYLIAPTGSSR